MSSSLRRNLCRLTVRVVKVKKDCKIKNEIGKIFRKHNIFEYKSPKDELNIDTFYKAVAYACLYKKYYQIMWMRFRQRRLPLH